MRRDELGDWFREKKNNNDGVVVMDRMKVFN